MKRYYKIGISGHRDLLPSQKEENSLILKGHLLKLQREYPKRELLILSPLADGADRLIVEVAQKLEIKYDAILPMPKALSAFKQVPKPTTTLNPKINLFIYYLQKFILSSR